ncbi:MAG: hypothetical protein K0V04_11150 [Deltaproteobacteria bacterium]|nr:hypothetical protein [Deltaproteobacteria bacterium]
MVGLLVLAAVLVGVVFALGGRLEAATWGLVVAAGAMVLALQSLYRMAVALAKPPVEVELERADLATVAGARALRDERRRVLRAINELHFDYEMGKLSDDDYRKVREGYELRAVEVMRALDSESALHPALAEELRKRGLADDGSSTDGVAQADDAADAMAAEHSATEDASEAASATADAPAKEAAAAGDADGKSGSTDGQGTDGQDAEGDDDEQEASA